MADNDINSGPTLGEVYRAIQAVGDRLEKSIADRERAEHGFRNRLEATNLTVAVMDARLKAAETSLSNIAIYVAKVAGGIATVIGLLFSGLSLFWKKP